MSQRIRLALLLILLLPGCSSNPGSSNAKPTREELNNLPSDLRNSKMSDAAKKGLAEELKRHNPNGTAPR